MESECNYKNKRWEWKPPKQEEEGKTQVAITHQKEPETNQEEPGTTQAAVLPQQDNAARSNAIRSLIDYQLDEFPPEMS